MNIRMFWAFIKGKWIQSVLYCIIVILVALIFFLALSFYSVRNHTQSGGVFYYSVGIFPRNQSLGITDEIIQKLIKSPFVDGYNSSAICRATIYDFEKYNVYDQRNIGAEVEIEINLNTIYSDIFLRKIARLVAGTFPTEQHRGVVVEKEMAMRNALDIGDSVVLEIDVQGQMKQFELTVIGIYELLATADMDLTENDKSINEVSTWPRLFTNFSTICEDEYTLEHITLYTKKQMHVKDILSYVEMTMDEQVSAIESTDLLFAILNRSIEKNSKYINWMLVFLGITGMVLLVLFSVYVQYCNLYEMVILICIGKSKDYIFCWSLGQIIIQVTIAVGVALSTFIIFFDRILAYWVSLFTRNYNEGSMDYHFTFEYNAILSQINSSYIIRDAVVLGGTIVLVSLLVASGCISILLRRKAVERVRLLME